MKYIVLFLIGILVWSCQLSPKNQLVINGRIEGYSDSVIYVREQVPNNKMWMNDTLEVKNGVFVYKSVIESPRLLCFMSADFRNGIDVFTGSGEVTIAGRMEKLKEVEITGSDMHAEFIRLSKEGKEKISRYNRLVFEKSQVAPKNEVQKDSLQQIIKTALDSLVTFWEQQVDLPTSLVIPYFINDVAREVELNRMEQIIARLNNDVKESVYARHFITNVEREKQVQPGCLAYNFQLKDTSGKDYKLSDFRGKYVLLEFSASWCGWCKKEIPYLKQAMENGKKKELVILTISMDAVREEWVKDVCVGALPWPVISDLQAFDGELAKAYNVKGIPTIFLIDPAGKIITKGLRGNKMVEYINQL